MVLYSGDSRLTFLFSFSFLEIHEVFRKILLMGVLTFLPPMTRAAIAILVSAIACCTLNFFQPHRNRIVLAVAQMAFLLSTFKYIMAVLISNSLEGDDGFFMGLLMILMDVTFMLGSMVSALIVVYVLRKKMVAMQKEEKKNQTKVLPSEKNEVLPGGRGKEFWSVKK